MKKYTIEEFGKGKKAVKISNFKEWSQVNEKYPLVRWQCEGYYDNEKGWDILESDYYKRKGCEVLTFDQIDFEEKFILPEKWCIKITKVNRDILEKYRSKLPDVSLAYTCLLDKSLNHYLLNEDVACDKTYMLYVAELPSWGNYTEITLEQFKTYILKEKTMEKEIIGYKLNGKATAEEVSILLKCDKQVYSDGTFFTKGHLNSDVIKKAKSLGILDIWFEPVFKEEEEFIKGEWLYAKENSYELLFRFDTLIDNMLSTKEGYQIFESGDISCEAAEKYAYKSRNVVKATKEQIEKVLLAVAKHKGFVIGVEYKNATKCSGSHYSKLKAYPKYVENTEQFTDGNGGSIYDGGKWAEIIKLALPKVNNYEGKDDGSTVTYGCAKFSREYLRDLCATISNFGRAGDQQNRAIKSITLSSGVVISLEQIEQFNKYFQSK